MATFEFSLKVISPMFIAGADPQQIEQEGIRIPSLRGVLRFWYRAMFPNYSPAQLREAEGKVFGDTTHGQGIRLRLTESKQIPVESVKTEHNKEFKYLGYGPFDNRNALLPNSEFTFLATGNSTQIKALKKALRLLHLFGGIGARSRRGWGSVAVSQSSEKVLLPYSKDQDLYDWINANLTTDLIDPAHIPGGTLPRFSAFSNSKIVKATLVDLEGKPFSDYQQILKQFYDIFQSIRYYKNRGSIGEKDHANEFLDWKKGRFDHLPKRIAFGFPFQALSRDSDWGIKYSAREKGSNKKVERRASPLFLKVLQVPESPTLAAVALFLKAEYFGQPTEFLAKRRIKKKDKKTKTNTRDIYEVKFLSPNQEFDSSVQSSWQAVEAFLNHRFWK